VKFNNIVVERAVAETFMMSAEESAYLRAVYPNAVIVPNEDIEISNVVFDMNSLVYFLSLRFPTDRIRISNSGLTNCARLIEFVNDRNVPMTGRVNVSMVGNYYSYNGYTFLAESTNNLPTLVANICGSMKSASFIYKTYQITPTIINNDLN
jgi:hypothetical protein